MPPVANPRRAQAAVDPSNCAMMYKIPRNKVIFPPTKAPKVTAGLTWPPEMLAPTETATNNPKACAMEAEIRPAGVATPSVSLLKAIPEP